MSHNRLTRQDIKRDEVLEGLSRVAQFLSDNARALGLGLAVVLAAIAAIAIWQSVGASREKAANDRLSEALRAAEVGDGDLGAAEPELEAVLEEYGSTRAGKIAHAYLGTIAADAGEPARAREHWQAFLGEHHDHALAAMVERNLISLDRAEGRSEELAQRLRDLLASGESALGEDTLLFELGKTLETIGQVEGALEIYERLLDEHPSSLYAGEARQRSEALAMT